MTLLALSWGEIGLVAVIALVVFLAIGYLLIARMEKTYIFGSFTPIERLPDPSDYHRKMSEELEALEYSAAGVYQDARGGIYQGAYLALLVDPTGRILVSLQSGILAGMPIKITRLWTRSGSGAVETQDAPMSKDISGYFSRTFLMEATAQELHETHVARLEPAEEEAHLITVDRALAEYEEFESCRAERLQRLGLATVDPTGRFYRHTWKGVFRFFRGQPEGFSEGLSQRHRIDGTET